MSTDVNPLAYAELGSHIQMNGVGIIGKTYSGMIFENSYILASRNLKFH